MAELEGLRLLKLLNILQKKNELVSKLSGGMKRKLSLAIALVGSPDVRNNITIFSSFDALTDILCIFIQNIVDDSNIDSNLGRTNIWDGS